MGRGEEKAAELRGLLIDLAKQSARPKAWHFAADWVGWVYLGFVCVGTRSLIDPMLAAIAFRFLVLRLYVAPTKGGESNA